MFVRERAASAGTARQGRDGAADGELAAEDDEWSDSCEQPPHASTNTANLAVGMQLQQQLCVRNRQRQRD